MAGCGCKSDNVTVENNGEFNLKESLNGYPLKMVVFLLALITVPFIMVMVIYFMFNTLVLNKDVDIKPLLLMIGNKFKTSADDYEEDDDYEEVGDLTEDDVVVYGVEEIERR